jgi:hypothetical protein
MRSTAAIALLLVACGPRSEAGSPTTVAGTPALFAALDGARPGETIKLAAGAYPQVAISRANFTGAVTIMSADPAHPAMIIGLKVVNSSGLNFRDLEFTTVGSGDSYAAIRVQTSQNISFSNVDIHGDPNAGPGSQLNGVYVSGSSNISITSSTIHHLRAGLVENKDDHLVVSNNAFHDLSKGGVEMGQSSDVTISNNNFTNFQTAPGVHGDAIQIYTAGTTAVAHDIVITGNLFDRGSGVPTQGIWMRDELNDLPFNNVTIDDNAMIGGDWNAVAITHATGIVKVERNVTASWAGADVVAGRTTNFKAWIRLGDLSGATVIEKGNRAQFYIGASGKAVPTPDGNAAIGDVTDSGAGLLRAWAKAHPDQVASFSDSLLAGVGETGVHTTVGLRGD